MELCVYAEKFYPEPGGKIPVAFGRIEECAVIPGFNERLRIIIIEKGTGILGIDDRRISIVAPAVLCINEKEQVSLLDALEWEAQVIYFHPEYVNGNLTFDKIRGIEKEALITSKQDIFLFGPFVRREQNYIGQLNPDVITMNRILNLLGLVKAEIQEQSHSYWSCRARSYFLELLFAFVTVYQSPADIESNVIKNSSPLADKIILYLNSNYEKKITISELSQMFHTNKTTLQEKFRDATGQSVMAYLIALRIKLATYMLKDTGITIMEISDRLGFSDSAHFNKMFRKLIGYSPIEYRKQFTWLKKA